MLFIIWILFKFILYFLPEIKKNANMRKFKTFSSHQWRSISNLCDVISFHNPNIIILKSRWQNNFPWFFSLALYLSTSAPIIYLSNRSSKHPVSTQNWYKILLVDQHWRVYVQGSIEENRLWVRLCVQRSVLHALLVFLWCFLRWVASWSTDLLCVVLLPAFVEHLFVELVVLGCFVGFYGISTFVGYLTPNPFLCK